MFGYKKLHMVYIVLFILLIAFVPDTFVLAADPNSGDGINGALMTLAKLLSWVWVFFAMLAGKLMTNDFVYGSIFHMDKYLWLIWNMVKNFANYIIGFIFIYLILKGFFDTKDGMAKAKKLLPNLLISSVLVQASWFLMGALIDISMIMTAAVGSLPGAFIEQSGLSAKMQQTIDMPAKCTILGDASDSTKMGQNCSSEKVSVKIENILPTHDSVSGPLYYMGYSIFSLHNYTAITNYQTDPKGITAATLLKAILVILFIIPIILFVIVNIIRIFRIWIWVAFSPFLVLDTFLFKEALGKEPLSSMNKGFKLSNVIGLIFQPVAVVATMGIAVIIVAGISSALMSNDDQSVPLIKDNITCSAGNNDCQLKFFNNGTGSAAGGGTFTTNGNFVENAKQTVGGAIGYLIMVMITITLLWGVLKAGFATSEITKGVTDSTFNLVKSMAMSANIPGLGHSMKNITSIPEQLKAQSSNVASKQAGQIQDNLRNLFGEEGTDFNSGESSSITTKAYRNNVNEGLNDIFADLREKAKGKKFLSIERSSVFRNTLQKTLLSDKMGLVVQKVLALSDEDFNKLKQNPFGNEEFNKKFLKMVYLGMQSNNSFGQNESTAQSKIDLETKNPAEITKTNFVK